ncbi:hypothetical protein QYM36_007996 [Artemia franciscana]|uniref:Uncharacterized protein n=1 Tax=Artemia franciscana TaxID=6661 RepID=A0AA88LEA1_ARTSF|nr:hypothetical protein QYM36_007996 [Artemia franciscana]
MCELRPQRRFSFSDNLKNPWENEPVIWSALPIFMLKDGENKTFSEEGGIGTNEVCDKPKHQGAQKSYRDPDSSTPEVRKPEIISDDLFYPAFMLAFDVENKKKQIQYVSLSENQGVLASEAALVTCEDNAKTMTGSNVQESLINSDTSDQLSKISDDDNGKEIIVSEEEQQRGESSAKKTKSDIDQLAGNCEAEQVQINDESNMELAKKVCSTDLGHVRNIWQSEMEGAYQLENVVHKDDKKITDTPTTDHKKEDSPIHVEGTKRKSQPALLGALEEEKFHLGVQKQMLQDKSSSSERTFTDNSDNAHNGKHQYSMWSRFKKHLTDKLGNSILAQNQSGKVKEGKRYDGKSTSNGEEIPPQELGLGVNYDDASSPESVGNESKRNEVYNPLLSSINSCKSALSNKSLAISGAAGLIILTALVYKRIGKN